VGPLVSGPAAHRLADCPAGATAWPAVRRPARRHIPDPNACSDLSPTGSRDVEHPFGCHRRHRPRLARRVHRRPHHAAATI